VYTPETSCMKGTSVHIKNMRIKQLCNRKLRDFAMAFRARKMSRAFEKLASAVLACSFSDGRLAVQNVLFTITSLEGLHHGLGS